MKDKTGKGRMISAELEDRLKERLQSKEPLFGKDSPFRELLQGMVNQILEGEMDAFQAEERTKKTRNKHNGHTTKRVLSQSGIWRYAHHAIAIAILYLS